jgi:hypothetical protein
MRLSSFHDLERLEPITHRWKLASGKFRRWAEPVVPGFVSLIFFSTARRWKGMRIFLIDGATIGVLEGACIHLAGCIAKIRQGGFFFFFVQGGQSP